MQKMQSKIINKLMVKEKMPVVEKGLEGFLAGTLKWVAGRNVFNEENVIILNFG